MILARLYRKLWSFDRSRNARPFRTPGRAFYGRMVALCDQETGSDGENFAEAFKRLGLGTPIGMRSWGGLIGIRRNEPMVDGGGLSQPEFAVWGLDRRRPVEGEGVLSDVIVYNDPSSTARGLDPQLDRAIQFVLGKMEKEPRKLPEPPPFPVEAPGAR